MSDSDNPFATLELAASRQVAEEAAAMAIFAARSRLILGRDAKSVFFATLALRLKAEVDWSIDTMATDGKNLVYNPDFVGRLSANEMLGVLAHEVMHNALAHPVRQGMKDALQWNIACDLAINSLLVDAGFVLPKTRLMPGEGKYQELQAGKSADEYYASIKSVIPPTPPAKQGEEEDGSGDNSGSEAVDPGGCGSVIIPKSGPAGQKQIEAEWKVAVTQAQQAAEGRGELPGGLARTVHECLLPSVDWRAALREFLSSHARNDYSWSRPNRRFLSRGLYLPGLHSEELGDVVLAVDTSGSIDDKLLGAFASEINSLLATFSCSVTVLYHDTSVEKVQTWQSADGPFMLEPIGGGGTSHICVFDWLQETSVDPACLICLTDLETTFPEFDSNLPVLWVVPSECRITPPFGQKLALSI